MNPRKLPATLVVMLVVLIFSFLAWEQRSEIEIWARGGMEEIFKQEGETRLTYSMELSRVLEPSVVAEEVIDITLKRLRAYGFRYVTVGLQGKDRLVIRIAGTDSQLASTVKRVLGITGVLRFHLVASEDHQSPEAQKEYEEEGRQYLLADTEWFVQKRANSDYSEPRPEPPKYIVRPGVEKEDEKVPTSPFVPTGTKFTLVNAEGGKVSGSLFDRVGPTVDAIFRPAVHFEFNTEGALQFGDLRGNNRGSRLAILLDDDIMQVTTIQDRISTRGQLSGGFSDQDVQVIVNILRSHSLPTSLALEEEEFRKPERP